MNDKRNINITIAGIPMNIRINVEDEEGYRKAAKEINQRVLEYKAQMGSINGEEYLYLAGVCLEYKLKILHNEKIVEELEQLNEELGEVIK